MQLQALRACLAWYFLGCALCLTPKTDRAQAKATLIKDPRSPQHLLRICNAYTSSDPLDVSIGKNLLTGKSPIPYKACREVKPILDRGSDIEFTFQNGAKGVFELTDLPDQTSLLLIVAYRNPHSKDDVVFHSHTFAKVRGNTSQLLVVDSYNGHQKSKVLISHMQASDHLGKAEQEQLQYNEVVVVDGGNYQLQLLDRKSKSPHTLDFVARDRESYVAIRVGGMMGEKSDKVLPEELFVFPQSSSSSSSSSGSSPKAQGEGGDAVHSRAAGTRDCLGLAAALLTVAAIREL